jgi:lipopolysaccharide biosynthesis glycosyltransferase
MKEDSHLPGLALQGYPENHAIVFCTDGNYWPHLATAIKSLLIESQLPLPEIYIFYEVENAQWIRKLNRLAKTYKQLIHFRRFGLELLQTIKIVERLGNAAYFRIFVPLLLDQKSHILYLDGDLIATSDISSIFSHCPTGSQCVAARNSLKIELTYQNERLGRPLDTPYFNSGVLLIDAVHWRDSDCTEKMVSILKEFPDLCLYADQDALNLFIEGQFRALPYEYNVTRRFYEDQLDYSYPEEELLVNNATKAPVIVHYTSPSKPWHLHNKHPLRHRYRSLRGSFHWYPYSLCISLTETTLELLEKTKNKLSKLLKN